MVTWVPRIIKSLCKIAIQRFLTMKNNHRGEMIACWPQKNIFQFEISALNHKGTRITRRFGEFGNSFLSMLGRFFFERERERERERKDMSNNHKNNYFLSSCRGHSKHLCTVTYEYKLTFKSNKLISPVVNNTNIEM